MIKRQRSPAARSRPANRSPASTGVGAPESGASSVSAWLAVALGLGLAVVLTTAVLELPDGADVVRAPVAERIDESGITHPVTAVLLNFRGYDTWLEVGVLVLAVLAILALQRVEGLRAATAERAADPVLVWSSSVLIPFMVLAGGYLLWRGTHAPGGAFQAGAVLGAAGVLLRLTGQARVTSAVLSGRPLRVLALAGFAAFLVAGAGALAGGRALLDFPPGWSSGLIVAIEAAVTISIGWTLGFLYVGSTPRAAADDQPG